MKFPEDIQKKILRKFQKHHQEWLKTTASPPIEINLDIPSEKDANRQLEDVKTWIREWKNWQNKNTLENTIQVSSVANTGNSLIWTERCWHNLGTQTVPEKLIVNVPEDAISWIGKTEEWTLVDFRYKALIQKWPVLTDILARHYSFLAESNKANYSSLNEVLKWICANHNSRLFPRQIPVAGIDSKWLENNKKLVCELVATINETNSTDFYEVCGLKSLPQLIRMRILDSKIRGKIGGLCDISIPCEEAVNLAIKPAMVFIVENLQTGLAFEDLPGSVVIMGLGYGVDILKSLLWLHNSRCIYWGDIDTHGFAILNRARKYLPALESILMDETTLLSHRQLWVEEKTQHPLDQLPLLTKSEQIVFNSLKNNVWGHNIRLEQERVCWEMAWNAIQTVTESLKSE